MDARTMKDMNRNYLREDQWRKR